MRLEDARAILGLSTSADAQQELSCCQSVAVRRSRLCFTAHGHRHQSLPVLQRQLQFMEYDKVPLRKLQAAYQLSRFLRHVDMYGDDSDDEGAELLSPDDLGGEGAAFLKCACSIILGTVETNPAPVFLHNGWANEVSIDQLFHTDAEYEWARILPDHRAADDVRAPRRAAPRRAAPPVHMDAAATCVYVDSTHACRSMRRTSTSTSRRRAAWAALRPMPSASASQTCRKRCVARVAPLEPRLDSSLPSAACLESTSVSECFLWPASARPGRLRPDGATERILEY